MLRIINRVAWLFAMLGGLAASLVVVMVVVSVAARAAIAKPIPGDIEITSMGVAICISLCLPWCQLHGANIIVDFFTRHTTERRRRWLDGMGALLLAVMAALLGWRSAVGAAVVREAGETTMILGLPLWWTYAMLAPGLALTALIAVIQAALHFSGRELKGFHS